jgi:L-gulonate 5-dehydrogenase
VVEAPEPAPGPGQVAVRVVRAAPYGTDVDLYRADRHRIDYPRGLGADFAGVIAAVGEGVEGCTVGDRVVAMALYHCGACRQCRAGRTNLCVANPDSTASRQECFQDVALVWANKLAKLPDAVSFEAGAMISGVMMGLNIAEKLAPQPGETVLVVGAGAMGWPQVALAPSFGCRVAVAGRGDRRLEICRALGADLVFDLAALGGRLPQAALDAAPDGFECVVETTASDWGVALSIELAGIAGRIAWTGGPTLPVDPRALVRRELVVYGVRAGHHQQPALDLVAAGAVDLTPTITHRITLEELPAAFALLAGPDRGNVGRIMVEIER